MALAATIPTVALLCRPVHFQVDSYAARRDLKGLERRELPSAVGITFKDGWYYAFVVGLLVLMLLYFKRESHAPFYATALLLVLNQWDAPRQVADGQHDQHRRGGRRRATVLLP